MTHKVVFVRHGESQWNVANIFTGWHDVDLSDNGFLEAVEAGKCLKEKGFKFDIVFTSVLRRAIRTAWTVCTHSENFAMPIVNSWRLNERHYGGLQGMNKADTAAKHGDDQVKIWRRSFDIPPPPLETSDPRHPCNDPMYACVPKAALPGAESLKLTIERVLPIWNDQIAPCVMSGKSVLVAAHGNSLRAICMYLKGMTEKEVLDFNIPTAVPLVYELDEDLKFVKDYYLMDEAEVAAKARCSAFDSTSIPCFHYIQQSMASDGAMVTEERLAELKATAQQLCASGKGFLASDESAGPWLRAGHAEAKTIPDTIENRGAYRSLCFNAPGLSDHISGVILHWETLFQKDSEGNEMVKLITDNGMLAGIKLDKGYDKKGMWGTQTGPLGHPEVSGRGLDDLQERAAQAYKQGARFAKWRNVLQLDPARGLPSNLAIADTVHTLARYASICQSEGLCPIVEPEVVPNGSHDIYYCQKMTEKVLAAQFAALQLHGVYLEGAVLKPNMVKNGLDGPLASTEQIADLTIQTLLRTVPPAMPGIFFLSGDTPLNTDNEETATINLSKMHERHPKLPWHLSFSYGKALQKTCIVTWLGQDANKSKAQQALKNRAKANSEAVSGSYVTGSCASVGTDGNISGAAGPY